MAGVVNLHNVREMKGVNRVINDYIRTETLKTIEARTARAQQELQATTRQYLEYAEQYRQTGNQYLEQMLQEYKDQQQEELDALNAEAEEEYYEAVRQNLPDNETPQLIKDVSSSQQTYENMMEIYESVPALPVKAMNSMYPGKRITQESGWNRLTNSLQKGWTYFVKWLKEEGWRILIEIGIDCILAFVPGIGQMLGMAIDIGSGVLLDALETCKTGAEQVALQRAINEGKSRGLSEQEEMFMWRAVITILMVSIADVEGLTIDGEQLRALMLSRPVFMEYMKNDQFMKDMWKCQSKTFELLAGEDPTTHEPDFQFIPEDVAACRDTALEILSDARMRGFVQGIPKNLKPFKDIMK